MSKELEERIAALEAAKKETDRYLLQLTQMVMNPKLIDHLIDRTKHVKMWSEK